MSWVPYGLRKLRSERERAFQFLSRHQNRYRVDVFTVVSEMTYKHGYGHQSDTSRMWVTIGFFFGEDRIAGCITMQVVDTHTHTHLDVDFKPSAKLVHAVVRDGMAHLMEPVHRLDKVTSKRRVVKTCTFQQDRCVSSKLCPEFANRGSKKNVLGV
jgi:hypothetical protein